MLSSFSNHTPPEDFESVYSNHIQDKLQQSVSKERNEALHLGDHKNCPTLFKLGSNKFALLENGNVFLIQAGHLHSMTKLDIRTAAYVPFPIGRDILCFDKEGFLCECDQNSAPRRLKTWCWDNPCSNSPREVPGVGCFFSSSGSYQRQDFFGSASVVNSIESPHDCALTTAAGSSGPARPSQVEAAPAMDEVAHSLSHSSSVITAFWNPYKVKHRRRTSPAQLAILGREFDADPNPSTNKLHSLAVQLNLSPRAIQIWFQNRRAMARLIRLRNENSSDRSIPKLKPDEKAVSRAPSAVVNAAIDSDDEKPPTDPWLDISSTRASIPSLSCPTSPTSLASSSRSTMTGSSEPNSAPLTAAGLQPREEFVVPSNLPATEMFQCLLEHGCADVSSRMSPGRLSATAVGGGSFGDIWISEIDGGTKVAIKCLRFHTISEDRPKGFKRMMREIYMWSKAKHPNVHELIGVIMFQGRLGMVSLWMENGNLLEYIRKNPGVDRYPLCTDVAEGVSYLHNIQMIHGDIKALNILVSQDGVARLSDFDHSILSSCSLVFSATTNVGGGTLRWMAPELLLRTEDENAPPAARTIQTDVYALGMTMLEILTGKVPYSEYRQDMGVYRALDRKQPPIRPKEIPSTNERTNQLWVILLQCWNPDPGARPSALSVLTSLKCMPT